MRPVLEGLKVCLLAGTLGQGGAERQLFYILKALVESGAKPRLLTLTEGELWEARIRELGVPVTWIGQADSRTARLRRVIAELRADRPDVLQSQHFYTNLYVAVASRLVRLPHIGAVRNDVFSEVRESPLGNWSLRLPRVIAANSRAALANAKSLNIPESRCFFLPNVVDTDRFRPNAERGTRNAESQRDALIPVPRSEVRLLGVGRLVEQKRFERFIRLVAAARDQAGAPVRAAILGDGPLREPLAAQAKQLGLGPDILEFCGDTPDIAPHYAAADIFVLTSGWEGTPNVVMEAMASGLAVVATRVGGVPELIAHGKTGLMFDVNDEDGMKAAVLDLIRAPERRAQLGACARDFIVSERSLKSLPRYLAALYERVLA